MQQVTEKLKHSCHQLQGWSKTHFRSIRYSIFEKTQQLKREEKQDP